MRNVLNTVVKIGGSVLLLIILANLWVVTKTSSKLYSELEEIEESKLALVLGTSKYTVEGGINRYFRNRMLAAAELYHAGKVRHILVSGDNRTVYYNEPKTMMEELVELGIPQEDITLDYAGLRTLDSIIRCKEVFGQDNFIIVTQGFHNHRALFISQYYGINAIGYTARNIGIMESYSVVFREYLARPLALIDLYILKTPPKFLGDKEELNI